MRILVGIITVAALLASFGCSNSEDQAQARADKIAVDKVLNAKCTTCHTLERWNELGRTSSEGREALLMRMRKLGAEFSAEDLKILKHLVKD